MNNKTNNYRVFLSFIVLSFLPQNVFTQQLNNNLLPKVTGKISTLPEISANFNEKWNKFDVTNGYYIENGEKTKAAGWKVFKRFEWFWEQRVNLETGEFPNTNAASEFKSVENSLKKSNSFSENWTNLGTSSSTGGYSGIGRINCVEFHPTDINTFWVGSPSGGIWRTIDGGSSWTILNNNETVLGVSDIAITNDYSTSQTLYIATGDRDGGSMWSLNGGQGADNVSVGVYKSTDGGSTWNTTGLSFSKSAGAKIYRLLIHPSNNSILLASTSSGIYKSSDAGVTWTLKTLNRWIDMEFKPGDPSVIYASTFSGYGKSYINRTIDTGENWNLSEVAATAGRAEIAVSSADPTVVYFLISNMSGGLKGIYKSSDSGVSFLQVNTNTTQNMLGYYSDGTGATSGQGSYDLCIAASPTNANELYIGGVNTWKSTDGGVSWTINNMWTSYSGYNKSGAPVVHADKHCLKFNGSTLFETNDGGIYKSTTGGSSWSDLSNGLVISQLYRIGVSQTNSSKVMTGLQDNGSKLFNTGFWSDVKGGDGMECIIDYSNSNYMYATYVNGQISRSTNGISFPTNISANILPEQPEGAWVTPYLIDPNTSTTLFAGYDKVWKTTNRGDSWTEASQVLSSSEKLRSLVIAPSNSNVLYAADKSNMWKTFDGGETNWSSITLPATSTSVTYIAVHPTDPNTVWITYGGYTSDQKVYESIDGGVTWNSISSGLPNLPVMSVVHYKRATDRNVLFVGTDLGVYVKDGANDWASYSTGLPSVVVTELEIYYNPSGTDKLRAGTYGRGLWETEIDATLPVELTTFVANSNNGNTVSLDWETSTEVNNYGFEIERKITSANTSDSWENLGFVQGAGNSNSHKFYSYIDNSLSGGNTFAYRLKQLDINGQFEYSDIVEVNVIPNSFILEQNYPNPFNPNTKISYRLPYRTNVQLTIYDVLGKEIKQIENEIKESGLYSVEFDANELPSGVYYYSLKAGDFSQTRKMMLVK